MGVVLAAELIVGWLTDQRRERRLPPTVFGKRSRLALTCRHRYKTEMDKSDAWGALEMGGLRVLVAVGISAATYKLISPKGKSTKPLDSARRGAAWGTFSALTTTLPEVLHTFSPQAWLKLAICLIVTVIFGFLMGFAIGSIRFWKRKPKIDKTSSETGGARKVEFCP